MRIDELFALAKVPTPVVCRYHRQRALTERARRPSEYREYGLWNAVGVARVRRLPEWDLGLGHVRDLLVVDPRGDLREVIRAWTQTCGGRSEGSVPAAVTQA
ncbi:hypothetical protein [Streptomyces sporangiiformans]|uniref:hypothetical protein n=1 Tax=Streptomyces sporangiiformans TaxID=2315329 RepID=UPI001968E17C|nr:hypothetical protein [Streptomyces sporangiiformans]